MTDYQHQEYGLGFSIESIHNMRCFKKYKRHGKTFWRNYKRDVDGGSSFSDLLKAHLEEHRAYILNNMPTNLYS